MTTIMDRKGQPTETEIGDRRTMVGGSDLKTFPQPPWPDIGPACLDPGHRKGIRALLSAVAVAQFGRKRSCTRIWCGRLDTYRSERM